MRKLFFLFLAEIIVYANVVRFGVLTEPFNLDPADQWEAESSMYANLIFDRLVSLTPDGNEAIPALAISWKKVEAGKKWIFYLRKGVKFHDGKELKAEDVVFSFKRQMDENFPYRFGEFRAFREIFPFIEDVRAIDEYTVEFKLEKSFSPFLKTLALEQASIVSSSAVKKLKNAFLRFPVGTGPFRFVAWERGKRIVLEENKYYWGKKRNIERLEFIFSQSHSRLTNFLKSGKIDLINVISLLQLPSIKSVSWLKIAKKAIMGIVFIAINPDKPPFSNVKVRKALNHLFNKKVINVVYQEFHRPAYSPLPPGMKFRRENPENYKFDVKWASKLLGEAGYKDGFKIKFHILKGESLLAKLAEYYAANLRRVGVELKIVRVDSERDLIKIVARGDYDLIVSGWIADYHDPDSIIYPLFSKRMLKTGFANFARLRNRRVFNLVEQARFEMNEKVRERLYQEIQSIIDREYPWIPLFYPAYAVIYNGNKIEGVRVNSMGRIYFEGKK